MRESTRRGLGHTLGSWLPVVGAFLLILTTIPFGTLIAHSLYRLQPDPVTERVDLPRAAVEIAELPTGRVVRYEDGRIGLFEGPESWVVPQLPAPCEELGHWRAYDAVLCPMRCEGAAILRVEGQGKIDITLLEPGGEAVSGLVAATETFVGTEDGRVLVFEGEEIVHSLEIGSEPVVRIRYFSGFLAALLGEQVVFFLPDPDRGFRETARLELGGRALDLDRAVDERFFMLTPDRLFLLDVQDPEAPRILSTLETPHELRRIKMLAPSVGVGTHPEHPAQILRDTGVGPLWWRAARGELAASAHCAGSWGALVCVGSDASEIRSFDPFASRNLVIFGVAGLSGLAGVVLVGAFLYRPPERWIVRLVWVGLCLIVLGSLLAGTLQTPIEALHILEYGLLGALLYRAVTRELGSGPAAAVLAASVAFALALLDEGLQWFYPGRTGTFDDVLLDGQAAAVGVALGWLGLRVGYGEPRVPWGWPLLAVALLIPPSLGLVHASAGFGHLHRHQELRWTSAYRTEDLASRDGSDEAIEAIEAAVAMDAAHYLRTYGKDPYLHELRVRLYRRDQRLLRGDPEVACAEQRILDHAFSQTLADTSFAWGEAERERCRELETGPYHSPVGEGRVTALSPLAAWSLALALSLGLAGLGVWVLRRSESSRASVR
ncbi:MAG: VanZ family protein [Deltaproteobacteria bacterium]|nr:MAG: VanZ family protein [Deltaproteobacteria bacterium]